MLNESERLYVYIRLVRTHSNVFESMFIQACIKITCSMLNVSKRLCIYRVEIDSSSHLNISINMDGHNWMTLIIQILIENN